MKADGKPSIKDLSFSEFAEYLAAANQPAYRAKQVWQWLFRDRRIPHGPTLQEFWGEPQEAEEESMSAARSQPDLVQLEVRSVPAETEHHAVELFPT